MSKLVYIVLLACIGCASHPLAFEGNPARVVLADPTVAASYLVDRETLEFRLVGIAGEESRGFIAYSSIVRSPHARRYFIRLARRGNVVGKIYALIGLNQMDPVAYAKLESLVLQEHGSEDIRVIIGCEGQTRTVSEIITGYPNWPLPVRDGSWTRDFASGGV